ncbi:hypothetical protein J3Q64DRAFT_1820926 [Phycomyces blakesleeanus]|uniref:Uncharacterized protein n=1 Tax=Phycomyces blakesleeanus TaxID=4837 RepID=A0ABR3B2D8_PHYBL
MRGASLPPASPKGNSQIASLVRQWLQKPAGKVAVTPAQLKKHEKHQPESLEARMVASPYAAILASPIRQCLFYRRAFPSKLLIRFGAGYHPKTKQNWAFPTVGKPHEMTGKGYYVKLCKRVLELFGAKGHDAAFRGEVTYPLGMVHQVEKTINQQALGLFRDRFLSRWEVAEKDYSKVERGFQCIVVVRGGRNGSESGDESGGEGKDRGESSGECCELNHKVVLGSSASSETPRIFQNALL